MSLITLAVYLVVALVVVGFLLWVVESAPFISATMKPTIRWVVIVFAGLFCLAVLLHLFGIANPLKLK